MFDDAEIARLLQSGDPAGLTLLLVQHGPCVRSSLQRNLGESVNGNDMDDVMNRAAYSVWRSAKDYLPERGALRAWFYAIARNAGLELLRRRQRQIEHHAPQSNAVEKLTTEHLIAKAAPDHGPVTAAFLGILRRCIAELPAKQRHIIEADLRRGDVADAAELAHTLQTTKNSIYVLRSTARKTLRRALIEGGYAPGTGRSESQWS